MDQSSSSSNVEPTVNPGVEPSGTSRTVSPTSQTTLNDSFNQLDTYAEQLRVKLPLAPPEILDGYMRFWPWVAIVFGALFTLISVLGLVGSTFLGVFASVFG